MAETPEVSVIVPSFNSSGTLARALDSVFAQTWNRYETIVVDDGSTDDFPAAIHPYRDRVTVLRQPNAGGAAARNTGAAAARGNLLAFLDADDFWHARKLELQVTAFQRIPDLALCWTDFRRLGPRELFTTDTHSALPGSADPVVRDFESLFTNPYLGTPGVMITKDVFDEVGGFRTDLLSAEDVDLWLRSAYGRTVAYIPLPLFFVVRSPGSITSRRMEGTYEDNLRVISDFCERNPAFEAASRKTIARARAKVWEDWGSALLAKNQAGSAKGYLKNSLAQRPGWRALYLLMKSVLIQTFRPGPNLKKTR